MALIKKEEGVKFEIVNQAEFVFTKIDHNSISNYSGTFDEDSSDLPEIKTEFLSADEDEDSMNYQLSNHCVKNAGIKNNSNTILGNQPFICNSTGDGVVTMNQYDIDVKLELEDEKEFTDQICTTDIKVDEHKLNSHKTVQNFNCPICSKVCTSISHLKKHIRVHKRITEDVKSRTCPNCLRVYKSVNNLRQHIWKCQNKAQPFSCIFCNKTFTTTLAVRRHLKCCLKSKNNREKSVPCNKMEQYFISSYLSTFNEEGCSDQPEVKTKISTTDGIENNKNLKLELEDEKELTNEVNTQNVETHVNGHMYNSHFNAKNTTCGICSEVCLSTSHLYQHIFVHSQKTEDVEYRTCPICQKVESNVDLLRNHLYKVHNKAKPFKCNFCNKSFTTKLGIKHHLKSCFNSNNEKTEKTYSNPFVRKISSIRILSIQSAETFANLEDSSQVQLISKSNSLPADYLTCLVCNQVFVTFASLGGHMRSRHADLKPLACKTCGLRFAMLHTFHYHLKTSKKCSKETK